MSNEFEGKTVVVIGGSAGTGLGISKKFALEGANVAIHDIHKSNEKAENEVYLVNDRCKVRYFCSDITDINSVQIALAKTIGEFNNIDILVYPAGKENDIKNYTDMLPELSEGYTLCPYALLDKQ
jgi:NAD(P)-dependent dehydrogenase (short-subunit alcohol dehydrogenase family)